MHAICWLPVAFAPPTPPPPVTNPIVHRLNARFAAGVPTSNMSAAGVLVHQFDNTEGGDDAMDEMWLPCPADCYGHSCWCAPYRDRWSASLISATTPRDNLDSLILFSKRAGGLVFAPNNTVLCAYPQDGGTENRVCDPTGVSAKCLPGCYTETIDGSPCWCDEIAPAWSCPNGTVANLSSPCAWKPTDLKQALTKQQTVNTYNEIIVDTSKYAAALPGSLEAIFFLATSDCATAPLCEGLARKTHAAALAKYQLTAAKLPLLLLNQSEPRRPFR